MAATILNVTDLSQRFGSELIFSNVTFRLLEREKVALVGANGSGKSSLFKILAGLSPASSGTIDRATGLRITYQAQESLFQNDRTVLEETLEAFQETREIGRRMAEIERQMADGTSDHIEQLFDEYSTLSTEFEARHGYEMEHRAEQVLGGLGFPEEMFSEPVNRLSGGQKTRVSLAKALLGEPDLLLLDEPTNHLDLQAIEWLEGYLRSWNRSFVIVSHDRYFLDQVTDRTLEMAFGGLEDYPGGYSRFLKLREERRERHQKEYEAQQEFIQRTEEFIRRYKAGQRTREARGRETRLERLERIPPPQEHPRLNVRLDPGPRSGEIALRTKNLVVGFPRAEDDDGIELLNAGEIIAQRGDRIGIVGPNGSGKTSLLRTIVDEIKPLAGSVNFGTNVKVAYYAQAHERLNQNWTALETILRDHPIGEEQGRNLLGRFLFSNDDVYKQVSSLSGGERSRLALARLSMHRANFLILDEPTNHLDILARESLETLLGTYEGTLLFVSHDRYFIDKIATKIWLIDQNAVDVQLGNYSDAMKRRQVAAETVEASSVAEEQPATAPKRSDNRPNYQADRHVRKLERELSAAEREVSRLEEALNQCSAEIATATAQQDAARIAELGEQYEQAQHELEAAYARWSAIGAERDALLVEIGAE